jgi:hypothetical protein
MTPVKDDLRHVDRLALIGLAFVLVGIAQLAPVFQDLATKTAT